MTNYKCTRTKEWPMTKNSMKGVISLKFSVFSDGSLPPVNEEDLELIRVPSSEGIGSQRKVSDGKKFSDCQIFKLSNQNGKGANAL
jgi:hypothetical protein